MFLNGVLTNFEPTRYKGRASAKSALESNELYGIRPIDATTFRNVSPNWDQMKNRNNFATRRHQVRRRRG